MHLLSFDGDEVSEVALQPSPRLGLILDRIDIHLEVQRVPIQKLAYTIANLTEYDASQVVHLAEAFQYRSRSLT